MRFHWCFRWVLLRKSESTAHLMRAPVLGNQENHGREWGSLTGRYCKEAKLIPAAICLDCSDISTPNIYRVCMHVKFRE